MSADMKMKKELSCTLCLDLYQNPLMLPCLHTFCRECLQELLKTTTSYRSNIRCPDCRYRVNIQSSGLGGLQKNFKLASIVDIYKRMQVDHIQVNPVDTAETSIQKTIHQNNHRLLNKSSNQIVDGHLQAPMDYYTNDSESEDDEWDEDINQDYSFLWSAETETDVNSRAHIIDGNDSSYHIHEHGVLPSRSPIPQIPRVSATTNLQYYVNSPRPVVHTSSQIEVTKPVILLINSNTKNDGIKSKTKRLLNFFRK